MCPVAKSLITHATDSSAAGNELGQQLKASIEPIRAVIVYATVHHDQPALLKGLRKAIGEEPILVGCSSQGVMARGTVTEEGYVAGAMALGGEGIDVVAHLEREVHIETQTKGERLASTLRAGLGDRAPRATLLFYDPLCGVDVPMALKGMGGLTPLVGGAAGQPWGRMVQTFQYFGDEVVSAGAVGLALAGDFGVELARSHGASRTGLSMVVTRADGNRLLELDGRPALDVWSEMVGGVENTVDDTAAWAVGIRHSPDQDWTIMAAFGFDQETRAVVLQASVPEGIEVMFHHRTVEAVMEGTAQMGQELRQRLAGRSVWAVLGFECGARTAPLLGPDATREENDGLQRLVAPEAAWLGMLAWGEVFTAQGQPLFCNYTYPMLVLTDR